MITVQRTVGCSKMAVYFSHSLDIFVLMYNDIHRMNVSGNKTINQF